jgi:CubicO group peptidase (beta-lactamase class C family)
MDSSVESIYWRYLTAAVLACASILGVPTQAATSLPIAPAKIDRTVERAMREFTVPGMAVGIVKDGKLIYAKGYGVRSVDRPERVDADTLFQIGSNTKAFTTAALAILVDEGKLDWDDKVIDHLPQFRLYDPYVTREFTIRDLLTHRSGLGPGAGDLMFYPETDFTRAEIVQGLRHLKPVSSFRARFDYDNVLYLVAGEIIPAVTGTSWEDFIAQRIFAPLQMQACAVNFKGIRDRGDVASPHVVKDSKAVAISVDTPSTIGPAGTINCSINGMARWLQTQLAAGRTPDGKQLFSAERSQEMWTLTTVMPLDPGSAALFGAHFLGYGLGWALWDSHGRKRVFHNGGVTGTVTSVTLIPELSLGVLVFANQQSVYAMEAVGNQIVDAYLGASKRDWVDLLAPLAQQATAAGQAAEEEAAKVVASAGQPTLPLAVYAGQYNDAWRGDATVRVEQGKLVLKISRTDGLEGPLVPYSGNIFIVRWNDRGLNADAYVHFEQGFGRNIEGMRMQAVSTTDRSFDFQDLNFRRMHSTAADK